MSDTREVVAAEPASGAAEAILRPRFQDLAKAIRRLGETHSKENDADAVAAAVHKVRVMARRASVALNVLKGCCSEQEWDRARRVVRRARRRAGVLRDADVHLSLIKTLRDHGQGTPEPVLSFVLDRIADERTSGEEKMWSSLGRGYHKRVRRAGAEAIKALDCRDAEDLTALASAELARLASETISLSSQDISRPEHLHELRLSIKRLRYTAETFAPCIGEASLAPALTLLTEAQKQAGEVNDILTLVARLASYIQELESDKQADPSLTSGLMALKARYAAVGDRRCERFASWWRSQDTEAVLKSLQRQPPAEPAQSVTKPPKRMELGSMRESLGADHHTGNGAAPLPSQRNLWLSGRRLAVIDIGSNSIRLLAVELIDERSWKPLAEERAMTRLAHDMGKTGQLCPEAMARSVEAIGRFKAIADKLGVNTIRAFATAAVREAKNKADFISLIQDRTGLKLDLVSALDEGKLTYRSVARVFDLSHGLAAVADIGGGSLEVVFSNNGIITENTSMPLGAVRLTEAFGGADPCAGSSFKKMQVHAAKLIARQVRTHDVPPTTFVGCGGAFTTLLTLAAAKRGVMIDRSSPALLSLGPVGRAQLKGLTKELRSMTLEQRLRVPGLPSDRADIIIAGFTVIERLMKHLGVEQVHVHPGGVREGLLLRMIDQEIAERAREGNAHSDADMLQSVREFATRCAYERSHSEHVAALAVSLFDQFRDGSNLIVGLGSTTSERTLLEAAAVLHDIGTMVQYKGHHKHSQTIIRHASLRGWSPRQVELLATIARYHKKAMPSAEQCDFASLSEQEQSVVRRLAAILRVADGLDRSHSQAVSGVRVRFGKKAVLIEVEADFEPMADVKAATQKSDLLTAVLGTNLNIVLGEHAHAPVQAEPAPGAG